MDDDLVSSFCAITGADEETAVHYLEAANFELDSAVSLFLDQQPEQPSRQPGVSQPPVEVRAPIAPVRGRLVEDVVDFNPLFTNTIMSPSLSYLGAGAMDETGRRLASLYRPPLELFYNPNASLDDARRQARQESKWLLINLHDPSEFTCQLMNRDVWNDPRVKDQLIPQLTIQQLVVGSAEAQRYIRLYGVQLGDDGSLTKPHWSLIDPRTGRLVKQGNRLPSPIEFIQEILEYIHAQDDRKREANNKRGDGALEGEQEKSAQVTEHVEQEVNKKGENEHANKSTNYDIDLGEEPSAEEANVTCIQFRLPSGERKRRRFRLTDPVSNLFVYVGNEYDLILPPAQSLGALREQTLEQAGLKNASLLVKQ